MEDVKRKDVEVVVVGRRQKVEGRKRKWGVGVGRLVRIQTATETSWKL